MAKWRKICYNRYHQWVRSERAKAEADFYKAKELGYDGVNRGDAYDDKAIADYTEAVNLDPTNVRAYLDRANAYSLASRQY
ncbi:MAG: tetratricopeptide repeat protein [Candidatus Nealsonbacteria bacterium]|nr:tetratricopeptide repeat protein [Candidatus Nealsonbacteria bacterium]